MQYYVPDILIRRSRVTPLTLTALTAGSKVTLTKVGSPPNVSLQYSTGGAWATYTIGTEITLASAGDYIKFRGGNSKFSTTANDYYRFVMSGTIGASGNVMSLVDSTCKSLTIPGDYCFRSLFASCTSLTTAPELPATTLATWCYYSMFAYCTTLTTAPALPATTLATYCYREMFQGCTTLTTAPALPATTLAKYCYYSMFYGCTTLTTAPALPATTLADFCYYGMFSSCSNLTAAPVLPATALKSECYRNMFQHCSRLASIEVNFTSWESGMYSSLSWVDGVASSGTFTKPTALPEVFGVHSIPPGWTVINK